MAAFCEAKADVIVAYETTSGTKAGLWYERLATCRQELGVTGGLLFRHLDGTKWTSNYFRTTHVYPLLQMQRAAGDPVLSLCSDEPGNRIAKKELVWSPKSPRISRGCRSGSSSFRDMITRSFAPRVLFEVLGVGKRT